MNYVFDNDKAIYLQLAQELTSDIISGKLKPGNKIPTVRELAVLASVNPNTVQKALNELEKNSLIYTERTNGKYVTTNVEIIDQFKDKIIYEKLDTFLSDMKNIGISDKEINTYLSKMKGKNNETNRM